MILRRTNRKGYEHWLDMLMLSLGCFLVTTVISLIRGKFRAEEIGWQAMLYFCVFGLWWLWLNRKKFCRAPQPA